jgi:pimeloyl-ACP methyl ester carboxylesterase
MSQARIDGIVLEYEASGTGEPVVMIHGAFLADAFRPMLEAPSLRGYRLITYHRRGYVGSTPSSRPLSMAEQAGDCYALLRHLEIDRAHIVGHSFGGAVALQFAVDFPDAAHSLALLEPALMLAASAQSYRESLEQSIGRYRELDTSTVVDGFFKARWPEYLSHLEKVLPNAFKQAIENAGATFEVDLPGLLGWDFSEEQASRIRQPVLSVLGGNSEKLWSRFGEIHRLLLAWLPNAESFILPNATHFLQVENPHDMAEALGAYFKRHPLST